MLLNQIRVFKLFLLIACVFIKINPSMGSLVWSPVANFPGGGRYGPRNGVRYKWKGLCWIWDHYWNYIQERYLAI